MPPKKTTSTKTFVMPTHDASGAFRDYSKIVIDYVHVDNKYGQKGQKTHLNIFRDPASLSFIWTIRGKKDVITYSMLDNLIEGLYNDSAKGKIRGKIQFHYKNSKKIYTRKLE